ncbi:hypothetical protein [Capnocytophaga sp. oral taxon 864]|uniref:hypothetical protein n=1 Tax=Capnocytophaga sp. oral taxon 864 TaxID=1316593 RepID=UPI0013EBAC9E|nr:hypothetical protein [Capnocytophaga sp. oral taxon 864]
MIRVISCLLIKSGLISNNMKNHSLITKLIACTAHTACVAQTACVARISYL